MDTLIQIIMQLGALGVAVTVALGALYVYVVRTAKADVERIDYNPADDVHTMPREDGDR